MGFALAFVFAGFPFGGPPRPPRPPRPPPADHWFARDKAKHFVVSAVLQGVGHSVLRANGYDYREAAWTAATATLSVGVGKELWDRHRGRVFSWKDLGADALGAGTGAVVMKQAAP